MTRAPIHSPTTTAGVIALSVVVFASILGSALRLAAWTDWPAWYLLPSADLFLDPSPRGWAIFLAACFVLVRGYRCRSHVDIAYATAGAVIATYLVSLAEWSTEPRGVIDARGIVAILFARVPFYVATLALVTHAALAIRDRSAPKT